VELALQSGVRLITTDVRPIESGVRHLGLTTRFWHEFLEASNGFQHTLSYENFLVIITETRDHKY
jgi:hypothetical protein